MITGLYALLFAALIIQLSLKVIGFRRKHRVSLGHGDHDELESAIAAQHNATEYIPIALVMMLTLELSEAPFWMIHLTGVLLLTGRLMHAAGMLKADMPLRVRGMQITIYTMIGLILLNGIFLPYEELLG